MRKIVVLSLILMFFICIVIYAEEATITGDNVNVRMGPGTHYDVIDQVNRTETYTVLEKNEGWTKISFTHGEGWVNNEFVEVMITEVEAPDMVGDTSFPTQNNQVTTEMENKANHVPKNEDVSPLEGKVIVLDPGHGGRDVGAIGVSGQVESDYTIDTVHVLKRELEQHGAEVILTRDTDDYVPLTSRSSLANLENADVFISVHYNSTPEHPTASGIGTYYYNDRDKLLASYVQQGLIETTGLKDRGVHQENLQVLRINHRPGLLLELGFISNQEEENIIQSHVFLKEASRGIIQGLYHYFSSVH